MIHRKNVKRIVRGIVTLGRGKDNTIQYQRVIYRDHVGYNLVGWMYIVNNLRSRKNWQRHVSSRVVVDCRLKRPLAPIDHKFVSDERAWT